MLQHLLLSDKIGLALKKEKKKDYKNVVLVQITFVCTALVMEGVFEVFHLPFGKVISETLLLMVGVVYMFLLTDMLRNFTRNIPRLLSILALLFMAFPVALLIGNPIINFFPEVDTRWPLFFVHTCLFYTEVTVIYFSVHDIFKEETNQSNRLWGSACLYLMIGIAFGSLFDLINIAMPLSLGEVFTPGVTGYIRCMRLSMNVLSGTDSEFPNASILIKNLGVIEKIWSDLFVLLIIGRLLSK
jgi:hypothetical protein